MPDYVSMLLVACRYTDAKRNFDKYFAVATSVIGAAKMVPGLEPNAVLSNELDIGYIIIFEGRVGGRCLGAQLARGEPVIK